MPYIKQEHRSKLIPQGRYAHPTSVGELNYVITAEVNAWITQAHAGIKYRDKADLSYSAINAAIGVLECAKLELYRRIAAPYEDKKIIENGDVYLCDKSTAGV